MRSRRPQRTTPALLSKQVSETTYFFLNLTPAHASTCTVCAGGRERCNPDYLIRRRKYGYTVLEFVASGSGHVMLDGTKFPLKAGSIFSYQQDTACEIHTDPHDCLVKYFICLAGRTVAARLTQAGVRTASAAALSSHAEIQSLFAHMIREGQAHTKFSQAICDTLLSLIFLKTRESFAQPNTAPQAGREKFIRVKQIIDAHAAEFRSLAEIARASGVAPVAMCKLFNQHLGLSPFRYLMRRKMEIAAEHLMQHGGLIKEAAAQVGFTDPYHFSRRFRHAHGVAPIKMRRLQQH